MEQKEAMRISAITMAGNIFLSLLKLAAGIFARSGAMISDAVHSASDVFSTIVVMIGIRIAGKEADEDHPYGHERLESVAAVLLAAVLLATGFGIGWNGTRNILAAARGNGAELIIPEWYALAAAVVSILIKEWMYRITARTAGRIQSDALMADAWHHRSDALSSIGSLVGIGGAMLGFPVMDSIASVVICVFIVKAAWDILSEAVRKTVDHSADRETEEQARQLILSHEGVICLKMLKSRQFGAKVYMDVVMTADPALTFAKAHDLAEAVHDAIEEKIPAVKHVMVHIEPDEHAGSCPIFTQLNRRWNALKQGEPAQILVQDGTLTLRFPLCSMLSDSETAYEGILRFTHCGAYAVTQRQEEDAYWKYGVSMGNFYRVENEDGEIALPDSARIPDCPPMERNRYLLSLPEGYFQCTADGFTFAVEQVR